MSDPHVLRAGESLVVSKVKCGCIEYATIRDGSRVVLNVELCPAHWGRLVRRCGDTFRQDKARGCRLEFGHGGRCDPKWEYVGVDRSDPLDDPSEDALERQERRDDELAREDRT